MIFSVGVHIYPSLSTGISSRGFNQLKTFSNIPSCLCSILVQIFFLVIIIASKPYGMTVCITFEIDIINTPYLAQAGLEQLSHLSYLRT